MKEGEMIRALGEIRDEYITEALPEKTAPRRKKKVFRWIAAAAACLLLGLYLWPYLPFGRLENRLLMAARRSHLLSWQSNAQEFAILPLGENEAEYYRVYSGSSGAAEGKDLKPFIGELYLQKDGRSFYRVKGLTALNYLIGESREGGMVLWTFHSFCNSSWTFGQLWKAVYGIESANDIKSVSTSCFPRDNTDSGKKAQKSMRMVKLTGRDDITRFYELFKDLNAFESFSGLSWDYRQTLDRYPYSFAVRDDAPDPEFQEEMMGERVLTVSSQDGTNFDGWIYTAPYGLLYHADAVSAQLPEDKAAEAAALLGIR